MRMPARTRRSSGGAGCSAAGPSARPACCGSSPRPGAEGVALVPRPGAGVMLEDVVARVLRDELVGADPLQREWLWHRMWELDRIEELPDLPPGRGRHRAVGPRRADRRAARAGACSAASGSDPAYASTVTFAHVEEFLDVATSASSSAIRRSSCTPGATPARTRELCLALREHVGDDVPLMYDGSAGFDLPDAIYLGRRARATPATSGTRSRCASSAITAYKWLAERVRRTAARGRDLRRRAHEHRRLHRRRLRVVRAHRAPSCAAASPARCASPIWPTRSGCGPRCTARASTRSTCAWRSRTPPTTSRSSLSPDVVREPVVDADGLVHAPTAPGFGLPAGPDYPPELAHLVVAAAPQADR